MSLDGFITKMLYKPSFIQTSHFRHPISSTGFVYPPGHLLAHKPQAIPPKQEIVPLFKRRIQKGHKEMLHKSTLHKIIENRNGDVS